MVHNINADTATYANPVSAESPGRLKLLILTRSRRPVHPAGQDRGSAQSSEVEYCNTLAQLLPTLESGRSKVESALTPAQARSSAGAQRACHRWAGHLRVGGVVHRRGHQHQGDARMINASTTAATIQQRCEIVNRDDQNIQHPDKRWPSSDRRH